MKNTKNISLALMALSLVLVTGCASNQPTSGTVDQTSQTPTGLVSSSQMIERQTLPANEGQTLEVTPPSSQEASSNQIVNPLLIPKSSQQTETTPTAVASPDLKNLESAVNAGDMQACDQIANPVLRAGCQKQITEDQKNNPKAVVTTSSGVTTQQ